MSVFRADLQFHPFSNRGYDLYDILQKMEEKRIDALACLEYPWQEGVSLDPVRKIDERTKKEYLVGMNSGNVLSFINIKNKKFLHLILGQEIASPDQGHHFLSIGALGISCWKKPEDIIRQVLDKEGIFIFDHPFASPQKWFKDISRRKEKDVFLFCQKYQDKIILEWNGYSPSWLRKITPFYSNVNEKADNLAYQLKIPIVPTTDTHAVNKRALEAIGTCLIEIPLHLINQKKIIQSLKENILSFNYFPFFRTVSFEHLFFAFIKPYLQQKIFEN
jgi:hypothetical protein